MRIPLVAGLGFLLMDILGGASVFSQGANGSYLHARPTHPVLPDFEYGYAVEATLPNGHLACGEAMVKTLPAPPLVPLPSQYFGPNDIRLGFVLPPYAQVINVYQENFTDGMSLAHPERVHTEAQQNPLNMPVTFGVTDSVANKLVVTRFRDGRKQIKSAGFPPLPTDYNRPAAYDFTVEAVWLDARREAWADRSGTDSRGRPHTISGGSLRIAPLSDGPTALLRRAGIPD